MNDKPRSILPQECVSNKKAPRSDYRLSYLSTNERTPFVELYLTSVVSAWIPELVCFPLDLMKTRMHIQGEKANKSYANMKHAGTFRTALNIIRNEGLFHLYGGLSAMFFRHSMFTGMKMYFYDTLRDALIIKDRDGKPKLTFFRSAFAGMFSGGLANFISSPADLVKVQMQMESSRRSLGEEPRVKNVVQALRYFYTTGGIRGLWKGTVPNALRASLVTLGDISVYDLSKRKMMVLLDMPDDRRIQFMGAMIAGFACAVLSTPMDVVKSRIMNQPVAPSGKGVHYSGTIDCFKKLVQKEGAFAMYKGFFPYWMRIGPWTLIFWTTFEQIRRWRGDEAY
ncbi:mitochondrial uncoupling protein 4C [Drosophila mojavensis]|uniref:Uncharacterized protein n=1 Tax=Drosophila mojavensis TaxID=7230 RepID=B4KGG0_DROMO|nr:mitochondrial uncoupling protein 4C [Drosophila mojavensis]EDW12156.1 uncharacterized protein Dmoj_GI17535 [Drosophila mojavensis]